MALPTYSQIKTKLRNDLDLQSEPFVPDDELLAYINDAIRDAETGLHTIPTEFAYFQVPAFINLVANQQAYTLPPDIYANKLLKMFYTNAPTQVQVSTTTVSGSASVTVASASGLAVGQFIFGSGIPLYTRIIAINGTTITLSRTATASATVTATVVSLQPTYGARQYEVRKIRSLVDTLSFYPTDDYAFIIANSQQEAGGNQILIYPTPQETGPLILLWYIREIRRMTSSTTDANNVLELPECENFVYAHVKWAVSLKSRNPGMIQERKEERRIQYDLMMDTLREMVADGNNRMLLDLSPYFNQEMELHY